MKRLLAIFMIGCMLLPASCKKKETTTTDVDTSTSKTSMEFLRQDYRLVTTRFPEAEGCMVQAQYRLNALVSEKKKAKDLYPSRVEYIYDLGWNAEKGLNTVVTYERNLTTTTVPVIFYEELPKQITGKKFIGDFSEFKTVQDILKIIKDKKTEAPAIESAYVTLCYPDIEFDQGHALYVFGSPAETNEHVCVDAISGEVFVLEIKDF